MVTNFNPDTFLARLRERCEDAESDLDTFCGNCQATLTAVDRDAGECTQCGSRLESDDESLRED